MDGSLLVGAPATQVTEPVRLEIGEHREDIRVIIVERIIEPIILGLAWLDKWKPNMWEDGFRKLRFVLGLEPEPEEQIGQVSLEQDRNEREGFPEIYRDLSDVFNEEECETLPPP